MVSCSPPIAAVDCAKPLVRADSVVLLVDSLEDSLDVVQSASGTLEYMSATTVGLETELSAELAGRGLWGCEGGEVGKELGG